MFFDEFDKLYYSDDLAAPNKEASEFTKTSVPLKCKRESMIFKPFSTFKSIKLTVKNLQKQLGNGNICPKTFSSIWQACTARKAVQDAVQRVLPFLKKLFKEYDFCIQYNSKNESEIQKSGFKNSVELGCYYDDYTKDRIALGIPCFGVDYTELDPQELEKYGYLTDYNNSNDNRPMYGDKIAKMNKEGLLPYVSFTLGDSLENKGKVRASSVKNPQPESIPGYINKDYTVLFWLSNKILDNSIYSLTPMGICNALREYNLDYFELQFHRNGAIPWKLVLEERFLESGGDKGVFAASDFHMSEYGGVEYFDF